jgi:hypothetical protein
LFWFCPIKYPARTSEQTIVTIIVFFMVFLLLKKVLEK